VIQRRCQLRSAQNAATRYHILRLKCNKYDFGWGSTPHPTGGAHIAPPDSLDGFNRRESKERGKERKEKERGKRTRKERTGNRRGGRKCRGGKEKIKGGRNETFNIAVP